MRAVAVGSQCRTSGLAVPLWYDQAMSTERKELRTYSDSSEYLKKAVTKRRRVLKLRAIEALGGKCVLCGYTSHPGVLDFHHVDASLKSFGISTGGFSRSWASIEAVDNAYRQLQGL